MNAEARTARRMRGKHESPTPGLSAKLIEALIAHRTAGLQAMLAGNPKITLTAVVHALALDCLYTPVSGSCVKVGAKMTYLERAPAPAAG